MLGLETKKQERIEKWLKQAPECLFILEADVDVEYTNNRVIGKYLPLIVKDGHTITIRGIVNYGHNQ